MCTPRTSCASPKRSAIPVSKICKGLFQKRLSTAAPGFEARVKALEDELGSREDQQRGRLPARSRGARRRLAADNARRTSPRTIWPGLCRPSGKGRRRLSARAAPLGAGRRAAALRAHHARQALRPARSERGARDPHGADDRATRRPGGGIVPLLRDGSRQRGREVAAKGNTIIAISDSTLSPLAKSADVLFAVPEHEYTFSRSLAAPMCLAQAFTVALAARLQNNAEDPRIPTVTGHSPSGTRRSRGRLRHGERRAMLRSGAHRSVGGRRLARVSAPDGLVEVDDRAGHQSGVVGSDEVHARATSAGSISRPKGSLAAAFASQSGSPDSAHPAARARCRRPSSRCRAG